jgi:hypothetical protein
VKASRKRLFADVELNDEAATDLVKLSSAPTSLPPIAPYIRRLASIGFLSPSFWNETFPCLTVLEGLDLRSLTFTYLPWDAMSPPPRQTVLNGFNNVARLHLEGIQ